VSIDRGNDNDEIFFLDMFAVLATSELERRRVVLGELLCVCLLISFLQSTILITTYYILLYDI